MEGSPISISPPGPYVYPGDEVLARALAAGELLFYYQPRVSLVTGRAEAAEALLRWQHPDGPLELPAGFIQGAERSGFITEISRQMFPRLMTDLLIIHDINPDLTISFNLSAKDFLTPVLVEMIREAIQHHQLDPRRLEVELTEVSVMQHDDPLVHRNLNALVALGVEIAMDDYSTGYSSIETLSHWPFSKVKIDHGLVRRMAHSEKCTTIVQASIRMAHQLGIGAVAEGIETQESYDFLLHAGCTEAQGFWIARPLPLEEYLAFVRQDRRWSGLPTGLIHMATLDHIHWRQSLITQITAIAFGSAPREGAIRATLAELEPDRCKLGRWYYNEGQEFRGTPLFDQLEGPHNRLHQLGRELLMAAENGESHNALVQRLRELTRQSAVVLELLQELESEALIDQSTDASLVHRGG